MSKDINKQVKELPTLVANGHIYTIDFALSEIRRFDYDIGMKFIPFDSVAGRYLLKQYYINHK